jgi:hypothetical protein
MSYDCHSRLSGIFLKEEGFWTDPRQSEDKSQNDTIAD